MDLRVLIAEVRKRPPLWDQKDKSHHNRFVLDKLWDEVALQLNTNRLTARKKWKALRDKFRTTLSTDPQSNGSDQDFAKWKYFNDLFFLKDQFSPMKIDKITNNFDLNLKVLNESSDEISQEESEYIIEHGVSSSSLNDECKKRPFEEGEEFGQAKRELMSFSQREEDDEDLNFFKSLLPHVKTFSAYDKLEYRMMITKVTQDFLKCNRS